MLTLVKGTVEHNPGTDSGAELDENQVAMIGGSASEFGQGCNLGIVGDRHGEVEATPELSGKIDAMPVEVGGLENPTVGVDDPGGSDPDP